MLLWMCCYCSSIALRHALTPKKTQIFLAPAPPRWTIESCLLHSIYFAFATSLVYFLMNFFFFSGRQAACLICIWVHFAATQKINYFDVEKQLTNCCSRGRDNLFLVSIRTSSRVVGRLNLLHNQLNSSIRKTNKFVRLYVHFWFC